MGQSNFKTTNNLQPEKENINDIENVFRLDIFSGVGGIKKDLSSYKDVINYFGIPTSDFSDDRGNRILEYEFNGLNFKFLNDFADQADPKLSFITVKRPFICRKGKSIFPGIKKEVVHANMKKYNIEESDESIEIWNNHQKNQVKLKYDKRHRLESIMIY